MRWYNKLYFLSSTILLFLGIFPTGRVKGDSHKKRDSHLCLYLKHSQ